MFDISNMVSLMPETDSKIDCGGTDKKTWRAERRMTSAIKAILFARE